MNPPRSFLPTKKDLEEHTKKLMQKPKPKKDTYSLEEMQDLDLMQKKEPFTPKEKKEFLETLAKYVPSLMEKTKEKMIKTRIDTLYLEKKIVNPYHDARLKIYADGRLNLFHLNSRADLEEENGYIYIHDYINTYPGRKNVYINRYADQEDELSYWFKLGKEMYECLRDFLLEKGAWQ